MKIKDISGQRFGRLTALNFDHIDKNGHAVWLCKCDCGETRLVRLGGLRSGGTKSCGCLQREVRSEMAKARNTTHGLRWSELYPIWNNLKRRCNNPNDKDYKNYGGRGISVCEEWGNMESFYGWAVSHGYKKGLTIDRIDVNGDYSPENCRWATRKEQSNNKRNNRVLCFNGECKTIAQWSKITQMPYATIYRRVQSGWSDEDTLSVPVKGKNSAYFAEYYIEDGRVNG